MEKVIVQINKNQRMVVYKNGKCEVECYFPHEGWMVSDSCVDALSILSEATNAIENCANWIQLCS